MNEKNYFSSNLKYLRQSNRMTQGELAKKIAVDQTTIGRWEDGNREPTIGNVLNISKLFGIEISDILNKDLQNDIVHMFNNIADEFLLQTHINGLSRNNIEKDLLNKIIRLDREDQVILCGIVDVFLRYHNYDNIENNTSSKNSNSEEKTNKEQNFKKR